MTDINEKNIEHIAVDDIPFPVCIIDKTGRIVKASRRIDDVFMYSDIEGLDIFALTGIRVMQFEAVSEKLQVRRNKKTFDLIPAGMGDYIAIYFNEITYYDGLAEENDRNKIVIAVVNIDNYDELIASTAEENRSIIISDIDKELRQWGAKFNASVTKTKANQYFIVLKNHEYQRMYDGKFAIFEDVREIQTEADFPVTLSIGFGLDGKNLAVTDQYAMAAVDLALARGGDQAVIKRGNFIEHFGGKSEAVEKRNKGKSRIVAHAIVQLINQASRVLIMGHRNPDMDSFGAALGMYRLADACDIEAHVVINTYTESLADIFLQAKESGLYSFINHDRAIKMLDKDTLLVVVDTHRPTMTECPVLLEMAEKIAVLDHHRRSTDAIENPTLAYMEPYASSTSELVTEILEYTLDKRDLEKMDAEALLAGITVDTNHFSVKTGVRTFDAASWLRGMGADTTAVRRFFKTDEASFRIRSKAVADAEFLDEGIALSTTSEAHPNIQVINAQAADELMEIKSVRASFVAGRDDQGHTLISARSLGDFNVQVIMEHFGGGGHMLTAGAQVDEEPGKAIENIKELLKTGKFK